MQKQKRKAAKRKKALLKKEPLEERYGYKAHVEKAIDTLRILIPLDDRKGEVRVAAKSKIHKEYGIKARNITTLIKHIVYHVEEELGIDTFELVERLIEKGDVESKKILATMLPYSTQALNNTFLLALLSVDDDKDVRRRARKALRKITGERIDEESLAYIASTDFNSLYLSNLFIWERECLIKELESKPKEADEDDWEALSDYREELEELEEQTLKILGRLSTLDAIETSLQNDISNPYIAKLQLISFSTKRGYEKNVKKLRKILERVYKEDFAP